MSNLDPDDFEVIPRLTARGRAKLLTWYHAKMGGSGAEGWQPMDFEKEVARLALDRLSEDDPFAPAMIRFAEIFSEQAGAQVAARLAQR